MLLLFTMLSKISPYTMETLSVLLQVDLIGDLYDLSPIIAILLAGITYLVISINKRENALKEKDSELKELQKYIRESEKENLNTLKKVSGTLDRVIDSQKSSDNIVLKEIDNLKDLIMLRIKKGDD